MHVCVFIFFDHEGFFRLEDSRDIFERYGSTILCCEYFYVCFYQDLSSLYLKMSSFTSRDETPACEKIIDVDIGYKSVTSLNRQVNEKILKISRLL